VERRTFITLAGVGAGMCFIPPALYFVAPGVKKYAAMTIERELHYLKLAPGSVTSFVDDYFLAIGNDTVSALKWKVTYYLGLDYKKSDRIRDLIKYYLLSSDFFINKTDESKVVNYLGAYSPYKSPVPNPYSFVIYPPDSIKDV
jgi:hypothetical protein